MRIIGRTGTDGIYSVYFEHVPRSKLIYGTIQDPWAWPRRVAVKRLMAVLNKIIERKEAGC